MNNKIKEFRQAQGLSQEELSIKSGVSRPTISMIETNTLDNIESKTMLKLAKALNCDIGDIFLKENVKGKTSEKTKYSLIGTNGVENLKDSYPESYKKLTESLEEAKELDSKNIQNEKIWFKTGWFKDRNGQWKFEVSDKNMSLKDNLNIQENAEYKLSDLIEHDSLFRLYPELKNQKVRFKDLSPKTTNGSFSKPEDIISINNTLIGNNQKIEGTLIHEIQHKIQSIENFENGSSTKRSRLKYYNSLGEIEASNTKERFIQEKYKNYNLDYIAPLSVDKNAKHKDLGNLKLVFDIKLHICYYIQAKEGDYMKQIKLESFILEQFDYENKEHFNMITSFDHDKEINKYIISTEDSFSNVIDYYNLYDDDTIYNKIYLVKLLNNEVIGSIELDGTKDDLYINYSVLEKYRNKGYCTNLLKQITKYLLSEIKQISLLIKKYNEQSKKLALKAGYNKLPYEKFEYYKYQINS